MSWAEGIKMSTFFMSDPEWFELDENDIPYLTEKAPPEAVESYNYWKAQFEESKKTGILYN